MRALSLLAALSISASGFGFSSLIPSITMRNDSNRPIEISVSVREGAREARVGKPILLKSRSGLVTVPKFFGPRRAKARYTVTISDAKHRRLGLFRLDSTMVKSAEKNGMRFSVNNQAVNVFLGSRRQRFLLLP